MGYDNELQNEREGWHDNEPPALRAGERIEHSPLPWHVYEGGNFVKIGTEGYEDYVDGHHYLGGPFSVAEMEHNATPSYESDHEKALANANLIVERVNQHATLVAQRERLIEVMRALRLRHREEAKRVNFNDCGCDDCIFIQPVLSAVEQSVGSVGEGEGGGGLR